MFLTIDEKSSKPKYKQIVDIVIAKIAEGSLKMGEKIPSINKLSEDCYLSRDTVEKAYRKLKQEKVIVSVKGKGYYTAKTELIAKINVCFLINKLSSYKMLIYNSFVKSLGGVAHTNLFIYHFDESLFLNLLEKNIGAYDYYVIMPHFKTDNFNYKSFTDDVIKAIDKIPKNKLIILDNRLENNKEVAEVFQDFENDIYQALTVGLSKINNYNKVILVYPEHAVYPYPIKILHGFRKFCVEHSISFEVIEVIEEKMILNKGDLFITIDESDLVNLVRQIRDKNLILGKDIGIISYNDTPLKDLLGITVISTDFKQMGKTAAALILNKKSQKIKNPFNFIVRKSI